MKSGDDIAQWAHWLEDSAPVNAVVPMMPTIGNHDDGPGDGASANYNRLFALPTNTVTGTEDYYSFVYNNLLVFSLSTQTFEDYPAQAAWMRAIASLPEHRTRWKVVFFHHPVYTTQASSLSHEANEHGQNPDYAPLFDDVGIDIVFQSHNHIYERFSLPFRSEQRRRRARGLAYGNGAGEGRMYAARRLDLHRHHDPVGGCIGGGARSEFAERAPFHEGSTGNAALRGGDDERGQYGRGRGSSTAPRCDVPAKILLGPPTPTEMLMVNRVARLRRRKRGGEPRCG